MISKQGHRAFALIELLVVVAIIVILAALLFPVYHSAKGGSLISRCLSHEKELCAALFMYADDNHGKLPGRTFLQLYSPGPGKPRTAPYMPYIKNFEILVCQKSGGYGCNISITAPVDYEHWAYCPGMGSRCRVHDPLGGSYPRQGRLLSDVKYAKRMMAFICAAPDQGINDSGNPQPAGEPGNGWEWQPHDIASGWAARLPNRHNGGTTYAFLDGHAQWLRPTGMRYGFPVATDGLDYDGDGTLGDVDSMR